jgi:UDP-3-O-[3-hydroxymyristoyl] glucosamine N-acyltransferase
VQIGHNCNIGKMCVIAGNAGFAGSVTLGDGCMVGGGASFNQGITVGNGCKIGGMTGVMANLAPGSVVMGYPERDLRDFLKEIALSKRLPEIVRRLQKMERARGEEKEVR